MKKFGLLIVLVLSTNVFAEFGNNVGTIQTINVKGEPDRFSIFINGDGKLEPNTVVIDNPPRIALDFANVKNMMYPKIIVTEPNSFVHRIRTSLYAKGRETISRITIDLKSRWDYSLFRTNDGLVLSVAATGKTGTDPNAKVQPNLEVPSTTSTDEPANPSVTPAATDNPSETTVPPPPSSKDNASEMTVPPLSSPATTDKSSAASVPPPSSINRPTGAPENPVEKTPETPAATVPTQPLQTATTDPIVPPPQENPSTTAVLPTPSQDIVIGSEDLLEVSVFELPQFNTTARVQGDGTITMPLVGSIEVRGLKKKDVESKIATALQAKYVNNANVSVNVKEYKSRQVSVLGEVKTPGAYYVMSQRTLIQLLSEAGGLTSTAGPKCYVFRPGSPKIEINLRDLMVNGNPEVNILIYPGDVVNVPSDVKVVIYVLGAVRIPGAVHLSTTMPVTLLAAIAGAGGPSESAKQSDIRIKRKNTTGEESILKVNLKDIMKGKTEDVLLYEGDIVTVPESFF